MNAILNEAEWVVKAGNSPIYTRHQYEDAMLEIAKSEARAGESTAVAFARLVKERDPRISALCVAGREAEVAERARDHAEHFAAVDSGEFSADVAKQLDAKQDLMVRMEAIAKEARQEGESEASAFARAMGSDATMRDLYRQYREL